MSIVHSFQEGGVFMYFILIFFVLTLTFIVERALELYVRIKEAPSDFRESILEKIKKGDLLGAKAFADQYSDTALGRVASLGCHLRGTAAGDEELQARVDDQLSIEISRIDRRTGFLAMFGNVGTLLGLLGTIGGMITAFAAVAGASPTDRAALLSRGISEAMNCTAFGLIVAIPALVFFAVYQNRTTRLVTELTERASQIYHDLLFFSEPSTSFVGSSKGSDLPMGSEKSEKTSRVSV